MFSTNNSVVYPGTGVCKIVCKVDVSGKEYFKLMAPNKATILIPVDSDIKSPTVREIASPKDVTAALRVLNSPIKEDLPKRLPMLERVLVSKFRTGSILEIAEMVNILSCYRKHRRLSVNETKYLDLGIDQLAEEISLAKNVSKDEALNEINKCIV